MVDEENPQELLELSEAKRGVRSGLTRGDEATSCFGVPNDLIANAAKWSCGTLGASQGFAMVFMFSFLHFCGFCRFDLLV